MERQIEYRVFSEDLVPAMVQARDKAAKEFGVSADEVILIVLGGCTDKGGNHGWLLQARVDRDPTTSGRERH